MGSWRWAQPEALAQALCTAGEWLLGEEALPQLP